jgi:hypothetical protein
MSQEEEALILDRLERIERLIIERQAAKEWYTTAEVT